MKSIFSTVKNINLINKRFLQGLRDRALLNRKHFDFLVGDILTELCTDMKNYMTYCNNLENAVVTLELCRKSEEVAEFLESTEFTSQCGNTDLATMLSKPLARIAKYHVLVKEILQVTPTTHSDHEMLAQVLSEMEKMGTAIHEARRKSDNLHKILEIQNSISGGEKSKIWTSGRVYLREADFFRLATLNTQKLHFFLFNDVIVYVAESQGTLWKKPENFFTFKGRIKIDECTVKDLPDSKEFKNLLSIGLLNKKKEIYFIGL